MGKALNSSLLSCVLAAVVSAAWFWFHGAYGINLADEGYLWYGAQAVNRGELPIRDFQSYDPGRYWWTAAWLALTGDSLVSMRLGCVAFQALGILSGLFLINRWTRHPLIHLLWAATLVTWMFPIYKGFEQAISLMGILVGCRLLERPDARRYLETGLFVGLMAVMGRNHGAYLSLALGAAVAWTLWQARRTQRPVRGLSRFAGGVIVGYTPQLCLLVFGAGYWEAFLQSLKVLAERGTNLPKSVPWPWRVGPGAGGGFDWISAVLEGCLYLFVPAVICFGLYALWKLRGKSNPQSVATLFPAIAVAAVYSHHTFSRPDIEHLSHSVPASLLVLGALLYSAKPLLLRAQAVWAAGIFIISAATVLPHSVRFKSFWYPADQFARVEVAGKSMVVLTSSARILEAAQHLSTELARPGEKILFVPHWPGLYAVTRRSSPVKEIYFILPASETEEERTLKVLRSGEIEWVMIEDKALDGRDDLRFSNTHPEVARYIRENFEQLELSGLPPNVTLWQLQEEPQSPNESVSIR